jgi:hypothetical protein
MLQMLADFPPTADAKALTCVVPLWCSAGACSFSPQKTGCSVFGISSLTFKCWRYGRAGPAYVCLATGDAVANDAAFDTQVAAELG